jgi:hypothetical protein
MVFRQIEQSCEYDDCDPVALVMFLSRLWVFMLCYMSVQEICIQGLPVTWDV